MTKTEKVLAVLIGFFLFMTIASQFYEWGQRDARNGINHAR